MLPQRIVHKNSQDDTSSTEGAATKNGRPMAPVSFLDQIKNAKKKPMGAGGGDGGGTAPPNFLAAIKSLKKKDS
jgi:hypothetical protein